jgi:hypothetical protein
MSAIEFFVMRSYTAACITAQVTASASSATATDAATTTAVC